MSRAVSSETRETSEGPGALLAPRRMTGRGLVVAFAVMLATLIGAEVVFSRSELAEELRLEQRYTALVPAYRALDHDPEVVFLGDSRTIVDPADLERELEDGLGRPMRVFNLAMPGGPPMTHLAMTGPIVARDRPPELVVIFLSEFVFGSRLDPVLSRASVTSSWRAVDAPVALRAGMPVEEVLAAVMSDGFDALRLRRGVLGVVLEGKDPGEAEPLGVQGFRPAKRVDARTQRARAHGRAAGYRDELSPPAELNTEQLGYFEATLDRLLDHGIRVVVTTSPTSRPLWRNFELPLYLEGFGRARAMAAERGVPFVDYRETAVVADHYFADGDHLNPEGARRFTHLFARNVLVPLMRGEAPRAQRPPEPGERWGPPVADEGCEVVFDFEEKVAPAGWDASGDAFADPLFVTGAQGGQQEVVGYGGLQLLNSHDAALGDRATGEALSPAFVLDRGRVRLSVGGGAGDDVGVALVVTGDDGEDEVIAEARGANSEHLAKVDWDVSAWRGQSARLRVTDDARGAWGHILVDDVQRCD